MKGITLTGIALIFFLLLQTTVLSTVHPHPDGALIITLSLAMLKGPEYGASAGFLGGLIEDGLSGISLGGFCLIDLLIGWIIGYTAEKMNSKNFFVLIFGTAIGGALQYFLLNVYFYLFAGLKWNFHFFYFWKWLLLQSFLAILMVVILRPFFLEETIVLLSTSSFSGMKRQGRE